MDNNKIGSGNGIIKKRSQFLWVFVAAAAIGVRAGGSGGAAAPPVAKIFGQNACDSGKSTWDKIFID